MELTLRQFYSFLHELEKAKATLDNAGAAPRASPTP